MKARYLFCRLVPLGLMLSLAACAHRERIDIPASAPHDNRFLVAMLDHRREGDRMIMPCKDKGDIRQELRDFCQKLDTEVDSEDATMANWLAAWYQQGPPRRDPYPLWLSGLKRTEYEDNFLRQMIEHHSHGIEHAQACASDARHPELKGFCQKLTEELRTERKQMEDWMCQWFKHCGGQ